MDHLDSGGTASNSSCSLDQDMHPNKSDSVAAAMAAKNCVYTFSDNCDSDEDNDLKYKNKLNTHTKSIIEKQQKFRSESNNATTSGSESNSGDQQTTASRVSLPPQPNDDNDDDDDDDTMGSINDDKRVDEKSKVEQTSTAVADDVTVSLPIQPVRVRRVPNGVIPKSGKPMSYAMERKAATSQRNSSKSRGRPKRKALVAMYQSQITDNQIGIKLKLKLKKSSTTTTTSSPIRTVEPRSSSTDTTAVATVTTASSRRTAKTNHRKRSKKTRRNSDSEDSDYKKRRRKERVNNNLLKKGDIVDEATDEPQEQSPWGCGVPENVLFQIFQNAVRQEGSLPTLVRLGKVCSLWNKVSLSGSLWNNVDLAAWTKDRNELQLKWFIENRLGSTCEDVNLGE